MFLWLTACKRFLTPFSVRRSPFSKFGTGDNLYHVATISEYPGGKIPYSITFANDTFDVDSLVTKGGFPGIAAMCCDWANNKTSGNTLNLKGGSVNANVGDAVVNAQVCNINGTTSHNTGYMWRQYFCPANAARMPWTLNMTSPSFGKEAGKYLGIGGPGSIAYKLAVTQTNVVLPVAYSRMDLATAGAAWPPGITVKGRKTIIGSTTSAPPRSAPSGTTCWGLAAAITTRMRPRAISISSAAPIPAGMMAAPSASMAAVAVLGRGCDRERQDMKRLIVTIVVFWIGLCGMAAPLAAAGNADVFSLRGRRRSAVILRAEENTDHAATLAKYLKAITRT